MRIRDGFVLRKVGNINILEDKRREETRVVVKLNSIDTFLWNEIDNGNINEQKLIRAMCRKYEIKQKIAEEDVKDFLDKLRDAKVIA